MSKLCVSKIPHDQDGLWSWLVCFAAMMSWLAAVGFVFSFGIFFPVFMEFFKEDRERTAWIGSLAIAFVFLTGPLSGILISKFGCRLTTLMGALICAASLSIASFAKGLVTLYFSYSIPFGIGTSFVFNAGLVMVSGYFSKRKSLALGVVSAGQGLGVLAQGPLLQTLIDTYGWRTTYRIMSGVIFGICLLGATYDSNVNPEEAQVKSEDLPLATDESQPRPQGLGRRGLLLDVSVWKIPTFVILTVSSSIAQFGHFVPQIHLVRFCEDLGFSADKASKLYIYYGLSSSIARVLAGRICDIKLINSFYVYQSVEFIVGLSSILVTLAKDYAALIVFMVVYGICDGTFVTTLNVILMTCVDTDKRPASLGWNMQVTSIFLASGPPIAGLIADQSGSYDSAFYMSGSVVILAALVPFSLLFTKRKENGCENEKRQEVFEQSKRLPMESSSNDGNLL